MEYRFEILGNELKITETGLLYLEYSWKYFENLIKISNFSKRAEYITDRYQRGRGAVH